LGEPGDRTRRQANRRATPAAQIFNGGPPKAALRSADQMGMHRAAPRFPVIFFVKSFFSRVTTPGLIRKALSDFCELLRG
jgi:hypothetical protein